MLAKKRSLFPLLTAWSKTLHFTAMTTRRHVQNRIVQIEETVGLQFGLGVALYLKVVFAQRRIP